MLPQWILTVFLLSLSNVSVVGLVHWMEERSCGMAAPEFTRTRSFLGPVACSMASMVVSAQAALLLESAFLACVPVVKTASPTSVSQSRIGMCCPSMSKV